MFKHSIDNLFEDYEFIPTGIGNSPSGGGGGGKGGSDAHVTQTQTNPLVPDDMHGIADALNAISGGTLGAPVNFGATGLDAPKSGPMIPQGSMGDMYSKPGFMNGFNGGNVMGNGRQINRVANRPMMRPRSYGDLFSMRRPPMNMNAPAPIPQTMNAPVGV